MNRYSSNNTNPNKYLINLRVKIKNNSVVFNANSQPPTTNHSICLEQTVRGGKQSDVCFIAQSKTLLFLISPAKL
ncbi:MAG: hypothetical protein WBM99_03540 [Psychromonas sp.]